jgi:hypothetical protein
MNQFYNPDLSKNPNDPFARDSNGILARRSYWLDMADSSIILIMTQGIGSNLTNDEKRAHLSDISRLNLVDEICTVEILPPIQDN